MFPDAPYVTPGVNAGLPRFEWVIPSCYPPSVVRQTESAAIRQLGPATN